MSLLSTAQHYSALSSADLLLAGPDPGGRIGGMPPATQPSLPGMPEKLVVAGQGRCLPPVLHSLRLAAVSTSS
jgi:hypothetical protein